MTEMAAWVDLMVRIGQAREAREAVTLSPDELDVLAAGLDRMSKATIRDGVRQLRDLLS